MYFPDLSPYGYFKDQSSPKLLNIGWLSGKYPYEKGITLEEFRNHLFQICKIAVNRTRGFHICEYCRAKEYGGLKVVRDGLEITLGSAEIRVLGKDGVVYAAPNLIYHYVTGHNYKPPDEFIDAVLSVENDGQSPPRNASKPATLKGEFAL